MDGLSPHPLAKQRLQSASSPGIAARLNDVGHAQALVKLSRPPRKIRAHGQKVIRQDPDGIVLQIQRSRRKSSEGGYDSILCVDALRFGPWGSSQLALNIPQRLVVGLLPILLYFRAVLRAILRRQCRAPSQTSTICATCACTHDQL